MTTPLPSGASSDPLTLYWGGSSSSCLPVSRPLIQAGTAQAGGSRLSPESPFRAEVPAGRGFPKLPWSFRSTSCAAVHLPRGAVVRVSTLRERCITQQNYVPRSVGSWPSLVYALLCGGSRYKRGFTVRQLVRTIFTDHYRWLRSPPTSLLRRTTLDQPCLNLGSVLVLRVFLLSIGWVHIRVLFPLGPV